MRSIAADRGGICVSEHCVDNNTKLEWECARSSMVGATPAGFVSGKLACSMSVSVADYPEKTRRKRRYEAVKSSEP